MRQLERKAVLTVGPRGGQGRRIEGLRINFRVEKTLKENPNCANITIYNLSETTRALFTEKKSIVNLEVGYGETTQTLFIGDILKVSHRKTGPDMVTEVEAGDGEIPIKEAKINKSYAPGTSVSQILKDVAASFPGIKNKSLAGLLDTGKQFLNGFVACGPSEQIMNDLTKKMDLQWSVQDDEFQLIRKNTATKESSVLLSSETGMLGSPGKISIEDGKEKRDGVAFQCLLNPSLRPGRTVSLQAREVKGVFVVTKVLHAGDSHGGGWASQCEGVTLGL